VYKVTPEEGCPGVSRTVYNPVATSQSAATQPATLLSPWEGDVREAGWRKSTHVIRLNHSAAAAARPCPARPRVRPKLFPRVAYVRLDAPFGGATPGALRCAELGRSNKAALHGGAAGWWREAGDDPTGLQRCLGGGRSGAYLWPMNGNDVVFTYDSVAIRLPFDCNSTPLRPSDNLHYDCQGWNEL